MQKNTKINYVISATNSLISILLLSIFIQFVKEDNFDSSLSYFFIIFLLFPIIILLVELQGTIRTKFRYLYFEGKLFIIFGGFMLLGIIVNMFRDEIILESLLYSGITFLYFFSTGVYRYKTYNKEEYTIHI